MGKSKKVHRKGGYSLQDNSDFAYKYVKNNWDTTQFLSLRLCGPHTKPHGVIGLNNHYHMWFDSKLGPIICEIRQIPCVYV